MDFHSLGAVINVAVLGTYTLGAAWRGFTRRRDYWSRGSWIAFATCVAVELSLVACGFAITLAVDNHEPWVGAPHSPIRSAWVLVTLAAMTVGAGGAAISLGWFATGNASRQFPGLRAQDRPTLDHATTRVTVVSPPDSRDEGL